MNLISRRVKSYSEAASEAQSETEIVETVARPAWGDLPQNGWFGPAQWV